MTVKPDRCPKPAIEIVWFGTVIGGTGPAGRVVLNGQRLSAKICATLSTVSLLHGNKLVL